MNLLYLTHTCPYPPNRGDRIRCYHIMKHLAKNHELTLLYPVFDVHHQVCLEPLQQYCKAVIPSSISSHYPHMSRASNPFFRIYPLSVAFFHSKMMHHMVQSTVARYQHSRTAPPWLRMHSRCHARKFSTLSILIRKNGTGSLPWLRFPVPSFTATKRDGWRDMSNGFRTLRGLSRDLIARKIPAEPECVR